jgi:leucyl/phenylalanyl-tRNA--protein transferase
MSVTGQTSGNASAVALERRKARAGGEALPARLRRWVLGAAWALKPPRTRDVPYVLYLLARHALGLGPARGELPHPQRLYGSGLAGICSDLEPDTLVRAYRVGLYPFCHVGPPKWWAPEQRMVLFFENFDMEKNLRRRLRNAHFDVSFDRDFEGVVRGCAELRAGRAPLTWISPQMIEGFCALHEAGHAHSAEVWDKDGNLVGGAYSVSVGGAFFTESQFNRVRDAAKVGFAVLNCHLQHWGYALNDGKHHTPHLAHIGMELIPQDRFNAVLAEAVGRPGHEGRWSVDESLDVGNWDPRASVPAGS